MERHGTLEHWYTSDEQQVVDLSYYSFLFSTSTFKANWFLCHHVLSRSHSLLDSTAFPLPSSATNVGSSGSRFLRRPLRFERRRDAVDDSDRRASLLQLHASARARTGRCSVATPRSVLNIKHPCQCNPKFVGCCIQLQFCCWTDEGFKCSEKTWISESWHQV